MKVVQSLNTNFFNLAGLEEFFPSYYCTDRTFIIECLKQKVFQET